MDATDESNAIKRHYVDFFDDDNDQGTYQQKIKDLITNGDVRLVVNLNDLRRFDAAQKTTRVKYLLDDCQADLVQCQRALKEVVAAADAIYAKDKSFYVGFEGSFGNKHVTPRSLTSRYIGSMVCVEGIVTKASLINPKVVKSVHYCPATKKYIERKYTDLTSLEAFPTTAAYPTKDEDNNPLVTEYGLSVYMDHQTFTIQEMPEKAPAGQLPRSVDIIVDDDLVNKCKPGDRVQIIGMYRCLPGKKNGYTTGAFRTVMLANNIRRMSKEASPLFSAQDIQKIKKFARQKGDVFETLAKSLAPSIHGHEYIKKAVLCMLLGGVEKILPNGTRLRGDINVLLIGDPSVAKSQMLRYVLNSAPRAITTTGRGSSGVGLTAAVTTDQETGERRLEAGAMVLADRGVVCIDEFDKMSDIDRTAIHEVMEQGRVTIAKAGIHAKLNARCSVLAAANPVYGRYDQYKTPMENIGLQDSLLSRFDLIFIVLDQSDPEFDRNISDHVLRMHRYREAGQVDGEAMAFGSSVDVLATFDPDKEEDDDEETPVWEKYNACLHGPRTKDSRKDRFVTMKFMRKYVHIAKAITPKLTKDAASMLSDEYAKLRSQESISASNVARTTPVTPRTLETLIRLSTAHAKARLSKEVTSEDADAAIELIQFAYFKKVLEKEKKKRKKSGDAATDTESEEEATEEDAEKESRKRKRTGKRKLYTSGEEGEDPYDFDKSEAEESSADEAEIRPHKKKTPQPSVDEDSADETVSQVAPGSITDARLKIFKTRLLRMFQAERAQTLSIDTVKQKANVPGEGEKDGGAGVEAFSDAEIGAALDKMMSENQIMTADDMVFLI